ncbi:MAG: hypothetical protein IJI20_03300 [Firmicutes bacterium]|nr:hypothetical protein [Bacillota bacterium]
MKPQESREHRERRRQAARKAGVADLGILKDRRLILMGLAAIAMTMILLIVMTAYAASIKYEIGVTEAENSALWDDIKHLQSSQTTMNGVGYVEERAAQELKMKAAKTEQIVYVSRSDMPPAGFADVLKSKAYQ